MNQTTTRTLPPPTGISQVTAHLIADHDWPAHTPLNGEHAQAHDYLHGVGRPDLADKSLTHAHLARVESAVVAEPAPTTAPTTWRDGYMPVILAGLVVSAAGLFLPWLTVMAAFLGQISRNGLDTSDGKFIAVGLLVLLAVAYGDIARPATANRVVLLFGGLAILAVVLFDRADLVNRIADLNSNPFGRADIGYGLYVTGLGAAITTVGAWRRLRTR